MYFKRSTKYIGISIALISNLVKSATTGIDSEFLKNCICTKGTSGATEPYVHTATCSPLVISLSRKDLASCVWVSPAVTAAAHATKNTMKLMSRLRFSLLCDSAYLTDHSCRFLSTICLKMLLPKTELYADWHVTSLLCRYSKGIRIDC